METTQKSLALAIGIALGSAAVTTDIIAAPIVPDGIYNMAILEASFNNSSSYSFGSDGNWKSSFTLGCLPGTKGCVSQGMYDNGALNPVDGSGSSIGGDGVSGVLNITVAGGTFSVNSFNVDAIKSTAGGDFFQFTLPADGTSLMGGSISDNNMIFDPTGRFASITTPVMLDRSWNVDDCTLSPDAACGLPPNGNTHWETFSTGTASTSKGTISGTPLVNVGDTNGDGIDDFTATLVSGATMGSNWGGFFGAQYFEVWDINLQSVSAVPLPPAVWLFSVGLAGIASVARRRGD